MHTAAHSTTDTRNGFDQEEATARAVVGMLAAALYIGLWLYGGATWGSFWVSVLVGTLALLVLAAPLGLAVFVVVKAVRCMFKPRAPL